MGFLRTVARHASRGILVDTNLLLLYGIGLFDKDLIGRFKRTNKYTIEDFEIVSNIVRRSPRLITTPHILSEVSNLTLDRVQDKPAPFLDKLIGLLRAAHELHVEKEVILEQSAFRRYGVTDTGVIELAQRHKYLVLTDDFPLANYLRSCECAVLNLNHLRSMRWFG